MAGRVARRSRDPEERSVERSMGHCGNATDGYSRYESTGGSLEVATLSSSVLPRTKEKPSCSVSFRNRGGRRGLSERIGACLIAN